MIDNKLARRGFLGLAATASLAACSGGTSEGADDGVADGGIDGDASIVMVTRGSVNDQSFNELS